MIHIRTPGQKCKGQNILLFIFSFLLLFFVCCIDSLKAETALPETAKLVPPETVLLLDIGNFSQFRQQLEKTNLYKLYKDPSMAAFVEDFKTKWRKKIMALDNDFIKVIIDSEVLPQGKVAVALILDQQSKDANELPFFFISQWGQAIDKIKDAVNKTAQKAVEKGAHRQAEDYQGITVETIIYPNSSSISYALFDDCLIGALNLEVLKFVIAHIKGAASPTLADEADYAPMVSATGPYHDIDFYVNARKVINMEIAEDSSDQDRKIIANLGLDNVAALSCAAGLDRRPGSSGCMRVFLKIDGEKKGICRILDVESGALRAPRFIPASVFSVTFFNLNIKKAYDELYNIVYSFNPAYASAMLTPLLPPSPDGQPGVELKSGIIDNLGSEIIFAESINQSFSSLSAGSSPTETLFAVAVTNPRAFEKSMSLLHSKLIAPNNPDARRELLGHTIYLVSPLAFPLLLGVLMPMQTPPAQGEPQISQLAFTITDTHLIFGVQSAVEQAIHTLSSTDVVSVDSAKWFTSAKLAIPSVVGMVSLEDTAASSEFFWRLMIKEGAKSIGSSVSVSPNPALPFAQLGTDMFNLGLLPQFDAVRKYFGSSIFYGISRPDGFFFEFNYLNPGAAD